MFVEPEFSTFNVVLQIVVNTIKNTQKKVVLPPIK